MDASASFKNPDSSRQIRIQSPSQEIELKVSACFWTQIDFWSGLSVLVTSHPPSLKFPDRYYKTVSSDS